ncbi:MAG: hypothetical protein HKN03_04360 [Acidimicrobiales bacterium]|nr:hypothetical protein [Acidimicrobiales bacterium]
MNPAVAQFQSDVLGDGRIDNIIISSTVHVVTGIVVLLTMTAATGLTLRHAGRNEAIGSPAKVSIGAAAIALACQVLIGIKLLDQGQGIVQLYIHYVGGLIPMGAFLAAGWFARGDSGRSSRALAALMIVGYASALMAFFIGRAYATGA